MTYILWSSDFASYLKDYLMAKRCTWNNGSVWLKARPCKIYVGQWPIFHGPLILPYIIVRLKLFLYIKKWHRNVRVAERLALPTSDHGVAGSNPAGGEILPEPKGRFIAQSISYSPFHRLKMTEILLKGRKTLTHLSIHKKWHQPGVFVPLWALALVCS